MGLSTCVAACAAGPCCTRWVNGPRRGEHTVSIDIWRVEDGKFAEHWDIVDTAGLLQQLRGQ